MLSRQEVHMEIMALVPGLEAGHDYDHAHRLILARLQHLTAENQRLRDGTKMVDAQIQELKKQGKLG